ncbi:MAG: chemotaxis protein CheA [Acidobacteria bacterium]|nr:chemotaxis protein CheA [Acidobacteriota bacterium]
MSREDDRARREFTSEAEELLEALSGGLSELESAGGKVRPEVVNRIFREVHSLKGLAGMLGLTEISELSHNLEEMLDRLRMGKIPITSELLDVLYDSVDGLNRLVMAIQDPDVAELIDVPALISRIHRLTRAETSAVTDDPLLDLDIDEQTRKSLTEYEEHRLATCIREGRAVFSVSVSFAFDSFDTDLRTVNDTLARAGEVISTLPSVDPSAPDRLGFRLLFGTELSLEEVRDLAGDGDVSPLSTGARAPAAVDEEISLRSIGQTVRVDIARLDHVMNVVGELLIERAHLENLSRSEQMDRNHAIAQELLKLSRNLDRRLGDLQRSVIEMRMVPVGQIYAKLSRAIRKIARELGKEIELTLKGEDTELDKVMVEELGDPLLHLIRNAIDHGIESAEERKKRGKEETGKVTVAAYQKGNSVVIDVTDDGAGIDSEKVANVAKKRGLITDEKNLSKRQIIDLIFEPGFSTATSVSEISGRGVGLDVVKRNISALKGSIEILSTPGEGTTFRITLPITLAIIQALVVEILENRYAIPLTSVDEIVRIWERDISKIGMREVYYLREVPIPLVRLSDAFGLEDERAGPDEKWFVVVVRGTEGTTGIMVDRIIRQQEVVIKSIGRRLEGVPGVAGATEIGEDDAVIVVDTSSLIASFGAPAREKRRRAGA